MSGMKSLSNLKQAGKLHFWRGTIEIDERELYEICNEIQAEHDLAIAAMNKAAGNWAKADAKLIKYQDTRYAELFGTPERAARTIMGKQLTYDLLDQCDECSHQTNECFEPGGKCAMDDYDALLEWLRGDAE